MSVYDETDAAYGTGRCCWCNQPQNNYNVCHHPVNPIGMCSVCRKRMIPTLHGYCSKCYRENLG